jgi:pimeloyl-[acyl-carrier protein] methyl ester esterase
VKLVFVHGWGFDSSIWDKLVQSFSDRGCSDYSFSERGYFSAPAEPELAGDFVAVTQSFGTMRLLSALLPGCRGIVAINGFDRFTETGDFTGVATRMVERMIARFGDAPDDVLSDFRKRCGSDASFGAIDGALLLEDLTALRDGDCRSEAARCGLPILSLQGACDPILPPAMREAVFAGAARCEHRILESGGHFLPLQEPATCADAICAFMERLT